MRHETTYSITYQPIMNAYSFSVQTVSSLKMKLLIAFPDIKQSFRYTVKTQILILKNKLWLGKYFKDALKRFFLVITLSFSLDIIITLSLDFNYYIIILRICKWEALKTSG